MHTFFISAYRYFKDHKFLMYLLLVLSSAVFVFYATKLRFEEDITKLLPTTSDEATLAFGSLKVKDKIFVQFTCDDPDPAFLASCADAFTDSLIVRDGGSGRIANILSRVDDDLPLMALGYALEHLPSFVDSSCYASFERRMTPEAVREAVAADYEMVMEDEEGMITQMVGADPLALREDILAPLQGNSSFHFEDGHLFSPDGTVAMVFISPEFKSMDSGESTLLLKDIEAAASAVAADNPSVSILWHGSPVRSYGNSARIKRDLLLTIGAALLLILLIIGVSFKSFRILLQGLAPVLYGTAAALAGMYWIKGSMSLMALGTGAVVLGVALSYCLHVIIHYRFTDDVESMLRDQSRPVCLGCLTTVGAFLGLLFTRSDLLRDFGMFASIALVANTLFALIFLPHFLDPVKDRSMNGKVFSLVSKINSYPYDRNAVLLVCVTLLIVVGIVFTPKVKFDSNLQNIGYISDTLARSEALYAQKNFGEDVQVYYAASSDELDEALSLNLQIAAVLDSLKEAGEIISYPPLVQSLFISEADQVARIKAWEDFWTPERKYKLRNSLTSAARANGLYPDLFRPFLALTDGSYAPASLYEAGIIPDNMICNFIEQTNEGKYLVFTPVRMKPEHRTAVGQAVVKVPRTLVVDPFFYTGDLVDIIHDDFNVTLFISSIFVFLVLLLSFRNIWCALLAFMPMFFSWYVVQGLMAIFGWGFNLINIVITTFIFGIGVDYSIFVMNGLLAKARGEDDELLERHKVAIFFSALMLIIVVLSMLFAVHPAISSIGRSAIIGMVSTILITYTLQPFLFRKMTGVRFFRKSLGIPEPQPVQDKIEDVQDKNGK